MNELEIREKIIHDFYVFKDYGFNINILSIEMNKNQNKIENVILLINNHNNLSTYNIIDVRTDLETISARYESFSNINDLLEELGNHKQLTIRYKPDYIL